MRARHASRFDRTGVSRDYTQRPSVFSGGAIAFLLFSTVSIRVLPTTPASSAPQPAPSATQAASSGLCVKVGPLGLCLKV
jgi:hypothetical protein